MNDHQALNHFLVSQLPSSATNDFNDVFRGRAVALIDRVSPALSFLRDVRGVQLTTEFIRFSIELPWIWKFAMDNIAILLDSDTGVEHEIDISADLGEEITLPLRAYLAELPGANISLPFSIQNQAASKHHGYALMYFAALGEAAGPQPLH